MANNEREPNTKKRGRHANKLIVELFLLDPNCQITKLTKETCSPKAVRQLMQNGYGPPRPEHCTKDEEGHSTKKVEFSFELTSEAFKQKLVEIYRKLEDACFVFMKGEGIILVELNPGGCCFRCYTPRNVFYSERGQGRLYIKKIAESEISPCNHGVSVAKRPRTDVSSNQTPYPLILPKPDMSNIIILVPQSTRPPLPVQKSGSTPAQRPMLPSTSVSSGLPVTAQHPSGSSVVSIETRSPSLHSSRSPPINTQQLSETYSQTTSSSPAPLTGDKTDSKLQRTFNEASPDSFSPFSPLSDSDDLTVVELPTDTSTNNSHEKDQSLESTVNTPLNTPPPPISCENTSMSNHNLESMVVSLSNSPPVDGSFNGTRTTHVMGNVSSNSNMIGDQQLSPDLSFFTVDFDPFTLHGQVQESAKITESLSEAFTPPSTSCENVLNPCQNFGDTDGTPSNLPSVDSNMIVDQLLSTDQVYLSDELATLAGFSGHQALATSSHVLESFDLRQPEELRVDEFFEIVRLTSTLKISLKVLNSDALVKRLNESTIDIHTVEIESTCKLHQVLSRYSLPSCLKVVRIDDNNLEFVDICELLKFPYSMNSLHTLDLCRTKFKDNSFYALISVLSSCKDLISLSLIDNGLTKAEITGLITTFASMRNLKKLNLSRSKITEAQACDVLQELEQANKIASLDLSHNALQGNKIVSGICQLQSLEEVDLSHNYIRFSPLPDFEGKHDGLSINTKNISLSSNHMMPDDISQFCSLIGSDLLKLNLDFNHVCNSIWSLCSIRRRIKNLKVLSLENIYISDASAVHGLATLLSSVRALEELNLSSNNLVLADFQELESPLSNLSQLKQLNLSNNPDGISTLLEKILPSLKNLEELRLSNTHLNCDDLNAICDSLAFLKSLKYLELSMNSIGPDGIRELANILKEFRYLERLDLSRSCLQGDDINVLCQGLVPLKKLKYLNLSGNMIDSQILDDAWFLPQTLEELILGDVIHGEKLFVKLKSLQHLKILHLTKLKLRSRDIEVLATTLLSFPNLEELSLANIVVKNSNLDRLFRTIKSLENIKKIDLSGIELYDESKLADMLSSLLSLEELVLTGVNVLNMDDVRFFSAIKLLKRLRKLDLGKINVREEKALFDMLSSLLMLEEIVFPVVVLENSDDTEEYFSALASLRYLKNLDLRWSKICKSSEEALALALPSLHLLPRLMLGVIDCDNAKQLFAALGSLKYLKEFDLGKTCISKTVAGSLACVLPSLKLLEKLVLGEIEPDDKCGRELFAALGNLKYLKELHLRESFISETAAEALTDVLPSLTLLEKLKLGEIDSDYECDEQLFAALRNLKYLKELDLGRIYITKIGAKALARVLQSLMLLEKVRIVRGNERDEQLFAGLGNYEQLFAALGNLKYLKKLSLCNLFLIITGAEALAHVLPSLTLLEKLVLRGIDHYDECGEQLFAALGNLKFLKELRLHDMHLTKTGAEALARVLPSLTLLEKLALECIDHYEECDEQLFAALGNLKYLKELYLCKIYLTKTGAEALAHVLRSLTLLKNLVLEKIDRDDGCDEQLFGSLGNLKYLKKLSLHHLYLTKTGAEALACVLPSLGFLKELVLCGISFENTSDDKLFTAVGSLSCLNRLCLPVSTITQAGATALTTALTRLRYLKWFSALQISIENDEDGTLKEILKAAEREFECS